MFKLSWTALPLVSLLLGACGGDDEDLGKGTISVRAYGESFIEDGIPAADVDDGWGIEFNRFEVSLRDIVVADVALEDPDPVDVARSSDGAGHELGAISAEAREHGDARFAISRVEVEGSAKKGGVTKTFSWVLDSPTLYDKCETTTAVEKDETTVFQITVHADHLFYDSLVSGEPQLLFQPLADADADDDGEVSKAELGAAGIGSYDPGNEDIGDLWTWLVAQHRTLGHVDGEGHCEATAAE